MSQRIDFNLLKEKLSFEAVITHYKLDPSKAKGVQLSCFCPFPNHDGKGRSPSFSAHVEKGLFQCFGCKAKGAGILDFAVHMAGGDPGDSTDLRKAARYLADSFGIDASGDQKPRKKKGKKRKGKKRKKSKKREAAVSASDPQAEPTPHPEPEEADSPMLPVIINPPMTFELKRLDPHHDYFTEHGIESRTVSHFGLGYCSTGLMKGRIAIPIRRGDGELIAYAGRIVEEVEGEPKFLIPPPREEEGTRLEVHTSALLYNGHELGQDLEELVVVEGFRDVWHLWQHGYPDCCGIFGSDLSDAQLLLVLEHTADEAIVTFLFDGDTAGRTCIGKSFMKLGLHRACRWVELEDGKDPRDLAPEQLNLVLG